MKEKQTKLEGATLNPEAEYKKIEEIEPHLKAETERAYDLDKKFTDFGSGLPAVKRVAVKKAFDKLLQSD